MSDRPRIPDEEFALRQARLREELAAAGMDAVIAYADQHATFGQQNARYLFDYQPHFEACLVVVPREGGAFIATGPESDAFVQASSRCDTVRIIDAFCHPDEEYPHSAVERLGDVMGGLVGGGGTVGIAGGEFLPHKVWDSLRASTDAAFVEADAIFTKLRAVKSAAEIAVIRHAYKIAQAGMEAALDAIAPGVTERDVAAEAEYAMRRMGSEGMGIDTIVGAGREHTRAILTRTTTRPIGAGDHVLTTLAPRYEGYHGAIARVAAVGAIDPEIERAMTVAIAAQERTCAALKPGATGAEIDGVARDTCREADLEQHFAYSGVHSVGVAEFEPPILTSWSELTLRPGMVFSIDISIFFAPWGGLRVEDGFLVTESGAEPLQSCPKSIRYVAA